MSGWSGAAPAFCRSVAVAGAPSAPGLALLSLIGRKKWGARDVIAVRWVAEC